MVVVVRIVFTLVLELPFALASSKFVPMQSLLGKPGESKGW